MFLSQSKPETKYILEEPNEKGTSMYIILVVAESILNLNIWG